MHSFGNSLDKERLLLAMTLLWVNNVYKHNNKTDFELYHSEYIKVMTGINNVCKKNLYFFIGSHEETEILKFKMHKLI